MTFADLVGVQRAAARADCRTDRGAFLAAGYRADACARQTGSGNREFVTMLLPESSFVTIAMTNDRSSRHGCLSRDRRCYRPGDKTA